MGTFHVNQLVRIGGERWFKHGKDRVYFNSHVLARIVGLERADYKSGRTRSATLRGVKISNARADELGAWLGNAALYYDLIIGKWFASSDPATHKKIASFSGMTIPQIIKGITDLIRDSEVTEEEYIEAPEVPNLEFHATTERYGDVRIMLDIEGGRSVGHATLDGVDVTGGFHRVHGKWLMMLEPNTALKIGITNPMGVSLELDRDPRPDIKSLGLVRQRERELAIERACAIPITEVQLTHYVGSIDGRFYVNHDDKLVEEHHPILTEISRRINAVYEYIKPVLDEMYIVHRSDDRRYTAYGMIAVDALLAIIATAEEIARRHEEERKAAEAEREAFTCYNCGEVANPAMSGSLGTLCFNCYDDVEAKL